MPWTAYMYLIKDGDFDGAADTNGGIVDDYTYNFNRLNYHGQGKFSATIASAALDTIGIFEALENDTVIPVFWCHPPYGPQMPTRPRQGVATSWDLDVYVTDDFGVVSLFTGLASMNPVLRDTITYDPSTRSGSISYTNKGVTVNDDGSRLIVASEEFFNSESFRVLYSADSPDTIVQRDVESVNFFTAPGYGITYIPGTDYMFMRWTGGYCTQAAGSFSFGTLHNFTPAGFLRNYQSVNAWEKDGRSFFAFPYSVLGGSTLGCENIEVYEVNRSTGAPTLLYTVFDTQFFITDGTLSTNIFRAMTQRNPAHPGIVGLMAMVEEDNGSTVGADLLWVKVLDLTPEGPVELWEYTGKWYEDQNIDPGYWDEGIWPDDESCVLPNADQVVISNMIWDDSGPVYEEFAGMTLISSADKPVAPTDWWEQTSTNIVQGSS